MREALERVIADLDLLHTAYERKYLNRNNRTRIYDGGVGDGLHLAINKLREVLSNHE